MQKYKNKYRIDTARLKNWDYGSHGFYFVTICTKNKECYFGEIEHVETQKFVSLHATEIGKIAQQNWLEIPNHFPFIDWKPNVFGPQSQNLGSIIRGYKASVKKYATMNQIEFTWQPRYHDHIIHSYQNLHMTRHYIWDNPLKWATNTDQNQSLTQIVKNR
jgi:hypothetical protein